MRKNFQRTVCGGLVLSLGACSTLTPINPNAQSIHRNVHVGDRVQVKTANGLRTDFTVQHITAASLVGTQQRIPYSEIATIDKQQYSPTKTVALIAMIGVPIAVLAGWYFIFVPAFKAGMSQAILSG